MRHLKAGRKLGRNATHRLALMRNLTRSLLQHERIVTTVEKAKELRRFVEKLITLAKKGLASGDPIRALHARRLVLSRLGPVAKAEFYDNEEQPTNDWALKKLFKEIAPRFADRPGGYTRIIKRHERRLGDAGRTAFIELLKQGETKVRTRAPAPAPRVTEPTPPAPGSQTQTPPAEQPSAPPTPEASTQPQATPPAAPPQEQQQPNPPSA
jgi:large subunit ribosomal protein L17